jgi:hypothetical protein
MIDLKPKQKRRRRRSRDTLSPVLKQMKRMRLQFEKDASYLLSSALGFTVTVKIKRAPDAPPRSPDHRTYFRDKETVAAARKRVSEYMNQPL